MPQKPTILDHQLVAESRLFGIERLQLRFANGEERVYERLRTPRIPAVLVVAIKYQYLLHQVLRTCVCKRDTRCVCQDLTMPFVILFVQL